MQPIPSDRGRMARLALVGLLVLGLLAVVALASRSGVAHGSRSTGPTPAYVSWAVSIFLIVFVLMIPIAVWAYAGQTRERLLARKNMSFQARIIRNFGFIGFFGLVFALYYYARHHKHMPFAGFIFLQRSSHPVGRNGHPVVQPQPTFEWPVLWVALVLLAVGAAWWWWSRKNRPLVALPFDEDSIAEEVAVSIDDALDDLEAEPDARLAVIAAYARMETALGRQGLRRLPHETPLEYLRRILMGLTSQTYAVSRLTELFERAKFSRHTIDASMKRDAIDALSTIRDDLRGSPA